MKFMQFLYPNGRQSPIEIEVPAEVETKANELASAGWNFEIECNPRTNMVMMDCSDDEGQLGCEIVVNGPGVPSKVHKLVNSSHEEWIRLNRPQAQKGERK